MDVFVADLIDYDAAGTVAVGATFEDAAAAVKAKYADQKADWTHEVDELDGQEYWRLTGTYAADWGQEEVAFIIDRHQVAGA